MKRLAFAIVCMAMISCAIPIASAGPLADYGDAPDNTNGQVFAYPSVEGKFPSLYDTDNTRISGRRGIFHLTTSDEWLHLATSSTTTTESDALIPDLDYDENVFCLIYTSTSDPPDLPCTAYIVAGVGVSENAPDVRRYLNVLIDQNRDGEWKDTSFGKEWVAVNQLVGTKPGETELIVSNSFYLSSTENMWMRVTFTRTKINASDFTSVDGWDGSAPSDGFSSGETEDNFTTPVNSCMIGGKEDVPIINPICIPEKQRLVLNPRTNKWEGKFKIAANPDLIAPIPRKYVKIVFERIMPPYNDFWMSCQNEGIALIPMNTFGLPSPNVENLLEVKFDDKNEGGLNRPMDPPGGVQFEVSVSSNPPSSPWYAGVWRVLSDPEDINVSHYDEMEFEFLTIESSNASGNRKDIFKEGDDVYAYGNGYDPGERYILYIVEDRNWTDSTPILPYIRQENVSADADGIISPTLIWPSTVIGKYDIIVDINGNGSYDEGIDPLDDMDINDAGFETVPEFATIAIPVVTILGFVFLLYRRRRKE